MSHSSKVPEIAKARKEAAAVLGAKAEEVLSLLEEHGLMVVFKESDEVVWWNGVRLIFPESLASPYVISIETASEKRICCVYPSVVSQVLEARSLQRLMNYQINVGLDSASGQLVKVETHDR